MTAKKTSQDELQNMYIQLQTIEAQLSQIQEQLAQIELKKQEVLAMEASLVSLKTLKANTKSFAQMGLGIYAPAKLGKTTELLVNVGADVFVKKKLDDVKKILKNQKEQFGEVEGALMQNYQLLNLQAQMLQAQMQQSLGI